MSYSILINKNQDITYRQLLENSYVPNDVLIFRKVEADDIIDGYNKFYIKHKSSRGVALNINDGEYNVEVNICASTTDYMLAAKIALAIADLNNSTISTESDDEMPLDQFEAEYGYPWAYSSRLEGIGALKFIVKESEEVSLSGCIRPFYFGNYVLDKLSKDQPDEEQLADRIIEEIIKIQFIEDTIDGLVVPTLMDADFPEGVQRIIIILHGYKLLLQKSDWVILREGSDIVKADQKQFLQYPSLLLTRLDEAQFILEPIEKETYLDMMKHFASIENQSNKDKAPREKPYEIVGSTNIKHNKWWQFWKK